MFCAIILIMRKAQGSREKLLSVVSLGGAAKAHLLEFFLQAAKGAGGPKALCDEEGNPHALRKDDPHVSLLASCRISRCTASSNHVGDGLLGPNSIIVVYLDPLFSIMGRVARRILALIRLSRFRALGFRGLGV